MPDTQNETLQQFSATFINTEESDGNMTVDDSPGSVEGS